MKKKDVSLKALIAGGIATKVKDSFLSMQLVTGFALLHGAGNLLIGFLSIISFLANIMQIVAACLLERGYSAKKVSLWCSFGVIPFYLILVFLPLCENCNMVLILLAGCLCLGYGFGGVCGGVWLPWVKSLVPMRIMRHFLAVRFRYMMIAQFLCLGISYVILRFVINQDYAYMSLFFLVFLAICFNAAAYLFIDDRRIKHLDAKGFYAKMKEILKQTYFFKVLVMLCSVDFIQYYFMPFITVFLMKYLRFTMEIVIIFTAMQYASYIFCITRLERAKSCLRIFQYAVVMQGVASCLYLLLLNTSYSSFMVYGVVLAASVVLGAALAGFQLASQHTVIVESPEKGASVFMASCNCVRALVTTLGALCGGFVLTCFEENVEILSSAWNYFFSSVCLLTMLCYLSIKGVAKCTMTKEC